MASLASTRFLILSNVSSCEIFADALQNGQRERVLPSRRTAYMHPRHIDFPQHDWYFCSAASNVTGTKQIWHSSSHGGGCLKSSSSVQRRDMPLTSADNIFDGVSLGVSDFTSRPSAMHSLHLLLMFRLPLFFAKFILLQSSGTRGADLHNVAIYPGETTVLI